MEGVANPAMTATTARATISSIREKPEIIRLVFKWFSTFRAFGSEPTAQDKQTFDNSEFQYSFFSTEPLRQKGIEPA